MHSQIQTYKTAGKNKTPNVHGRHQTVCQKWKELETLINAFRIYSQDRMCNSSNEKRKTTPYGQIELLNQDKIGTLGEKETYKYLWILEANTIKQEEMKEKIKKGEPESYLRQNYIAETLSKE